jgi:hypothetical protein
MDSFKQREEKRGNILVQLMLILVNVIYASKTSESMLTDHILSMVLVLLAEPIFCNSKNLMTDNLLCFE